MNFKKVETVYWQDICKEFRRNNPQLAKVIDAVEPDKKLPLVKVTYSFGDKILDNGNLVFLQEIKNNPAFLGTKQSQALIKQLSYSVIPFGLILNKTCEIYVDIRDRIIPLTILQKGNTVGLFETLDILCGIESKPLWNATAGARSIFTLAKINNGLWHKRLIRAFNINESAPTSLIDQWRVFVALAKTEEEKSNWQCEIIFFTKDWIDHLKKRSPAWVNFREYLFRECWLRSGSIIERKFSFMWQQFSLSTIKRNYKPRIYITDTIRHLFGIVHGLTPGFAPAFDESFAPINLLKQAYHEVYDLPHTPTLMTPAILRDINGAVYYSLGYPTLLEGHPEVNNIYNTISDLKEIKNLMDNVNHYYQGNSDGAKLFEYFVKKINLDYYHKMPDKYGEIKKTSDLVLADSSFNEPNFKGKDFCATSPFLNGCIQIKMNF
jgi:hypothetical protein